MTYTQRHIYDYYRKNGGTENYSTFRKVLKSFNLAAGDEILNGYALPMGKQLSRISIARVKRDWSNRLMINWKESNELKAEILARGGTPMDKDHPDGEEWLIYHTEDWYCRFYWQKSNARIKNRNYYRFTATRGKKGLKTRLKQLLTSNDLAHLRFPFNTEAS